MPFVTNPVDVVTVALSDRPPRNQVFGSGTRYLSSALPGFAQQNIHALPASTVTPDRLWSNAEIGATFPLVVRPCPARSSTPLCATPSLSRQKRLQDRKGAPITTRSTCRREPITARRNAARLTISTLLEEWGGISDVVMAAPISWVRRCRTLSEPAADPQRA